MSTSSLSERENLENETRNADLDTVLVSSKVKSQDLNHTQISRCEADCELKARNDVDPDSRLTANSENIDMRTSNLISVSLPGNEGTIPLKLEQNNAQVLDKDMPCTGGGGLSSTLDESNFTRHEIPEHIDENTPRNRTFLNKQTSEQFGDIPKSDLIHSVDVKTSNRSSSGSENINCGCNTETALDTVDERIIHTSCERLKDIISDAEIRTSVIDETKSLMSDTNRAVNICSNLTNTSESFTQNLEGMRIEIPSGDENSLQGRKLDASCTISDSENVSKIHDKIVTNGINMRDSLEKGHNFLFHHDHDNSLGSPRNESCPDSPNSCEPGTSSSSVVSAADSGVSSGLQDEDVDFNQSIENSAALFDAELFEKLQGNFEVEDDWTPSTRNTYEPRLDVRKSIDEEDSAVTQEETAKASTSKLKSLFARSSVQKKTTAPPQTSAGWKLFGKVSREAKKNKSVAQGAEIEETEEQETEETETTNNELQIPSEADITSSNGDSSSQQKKSPFLKGKSTKKNSSAVPSSTTALILENRPSHLPPKNPKEEKKHREMYEAMIEEAKKKELRDLQQQKKKQKDMVKQEQTISSSLSVWTNDILPNWEMKQNSRKVREMWWQGLPPSVRGKVWKLAIGNDLHITYELFEIFQSHACEKLMLANHRKEVLKINGNTIKSEIIPSPPVKEHAVELITLDVSRTFPSLGIFQKGGPYHNSLHTLLGAYTCYRPDVGYVQGMSFLAAVLLLNLEPADAFICFANLLNKPCQMAFFRVDQPVMKAYFAMFDVLLQENLPKLHVHFTKNNLSPDLYLFDWIFTLYSKSLPLDVACRVWDVFCRDGDELLFRTALGILSMYEEVLLKLDFIYLAQFLTKLPDDLSGESLFQSMAPFTLNSSKYKQVLSQQKDKILQSDFDENEKGQVNLTQS